MAIDFNNWYYRPAPSDTMAVRLARMPKSRKLPMPYEELFPLECLLKELKKLRCKKKLRFARASSNRPATQTSELCICDVMEHLSDLSKDWITKRDFVNCLSKHGYSTEKALEKYAFYVDEKLGHEADDELGRLQEAALNAYNWSAEMSRRDEIRLCAEARRAMGKARQACRDLCARLDRECEKIMAEPL